MVKPTRNPFRFGDPVEGDYYLPRPELTGSIRQFIENRIHVILIGPRRFGKTSFVLNFLKEQESRSQTCLFVDVFNVTSHKDFLQQIIRALRSKRGWGNKLKNWVANISVGIQCERGAISDLRSFVQNTPNYIQMACFHLVAEGTADVTKKSIHAVLQTIVKQNSYAYQTILNSLTSLQQRALRLCARESQQIFSKEFLEKYEIPNAPTLASSIKSLKDKQLLDEGTAKGKVFFDDPLFSIWLKNEFD